LAWETYVNIAKASLSLSHLICRSGSLILQQNEGEIHAHTDYNLSCNLTI
jgi:hypothetical protein